MIVYILMLVISLFFASFIKEKNSRKLNKLFLCLSALPFFAISALRFDVGTDYMYRYVRDYARILSEINVLDLEIGFKILYDICIFFTNNSQSIFVITSLIIIYFIFSSIYKNSKNIRLSILLFFIGAFFFQSFNLVREYISISLIIFSYRYLLEKNYKVWIPLMLVSIFFHSTSIIYILISFGVRLCIKLFKNNKLITNYKYMLGIVILMLLLGPIIKESIMSYISFTRFKVYIGSKFDYGDLQIIPFTLNILLYLWMVYSARKKENLSDEGKFYLYIQFVCICIIGMGKYIYLINRLSPYFTIFQIISIPYFLSILKEKIEYKKYILHIIIIVVLFSATLTWTHILHSTDEVLPYKMVLNL